MHRQLTKLLEDATGESELVVVVFLDIRGFSDFAQRIAESLQTALYLKSIYRRILSDYFTGPSFYKPTGDGLMVIYKHTVDDLQQVLNMTVKTACKLVDDFSMLTADDDIINFPVPNNLGIGISRGGATRLVAKGKTIDYSGRPLNLAARLMDMARPAGVVIDSAAGIHLLDDDLKSGFHEEYIYVKGIAEDAPMTAWISSPVEIPQRARMPLNKYDTRRLKEREYTFRELKQLGSQFAYDLPEAPDRLDDLKVRAQWRTVLPGRRQHKARVAWRDYPARYDDAAGRRFLTFDPTEIASDLENFDFRPGWLVTLQGFYSVAEGTPLPEKVRMLEPD